LNLQNKQGYTALRMAAVKGSTEVGITLINARADLDIQDRENGITALHEASLKNRFKLAKALIDGGADLNIKSKNGNSALIFAALYNNSFNISTSADPFFHLVACILFYPSFPEENDASCVNNVLKIELHLVLQYQ